MSFSPMDAALNPMDAAFINGYKAMTPEEMRKKRHDDGQCEDCGQQTHKIAKWGAFKKRKPLTIHGKVKDGRCLKCHHHKGDEDFEESVRKSKKDDSLQKKTSNQSGHKSSLSNSEVSQHEPEAVDHAAENWFKGVTKVIITNQFKTKDMGVEVVDGSHNVNSYKVGNDLHDSQEIDDEVRDNLKSRTEFDEKEDVGDVMKGDLEDNQQVEEDLSVEDENNDFKDFSDAEDNKIGQRVNQGSGDDSDDENLDTIIPRPVIEVQPPPRGSNGSAMDQMVSFLGDFDSQLIAETMLDLHENANIQIEACKVLKDRVMTDLDSFITSGATLYVIDSIEEHFTNPQVIIHAFALMSVACSKSDTLRDVFIGNDGLVMINNVFVAFARNEDVLQEVATLLIAICNDQSRSDLVASYGLLPDLIKISKNEKYATDTRVAISRTLSVIASRSDVAKQEIELMS